MIEASLEQLNTTFETAYPQEILGWAAHTYGDGLAVVTSFQPTGIVTLHMLRSIAPDTPVLTLDTGLLFPETYALIDEVEKLLGLHVIRIRPAQTVDQQADTYGPNLWEHDPDCCCQLRKIAPLNEALKGYDAWVTGLRRDQYAGRRETPIVSWDDKRQMVKLSPLATWTEAMVWTYIQAHELPHNRLHDQGYPSIGCYPCTQAVAPGSEDRRAGRWAGHAKTECGIHISPTSKETTL